MTITIINYESGNLHSTQKAFEKAADVTGQKVLVTNNPQDINSASHIILPGVGAFGDCMAGLSAIPNMLETLEKRVQAGVPFLGICVGMQLLATKGFEHCEHKGLGWMDAEVVEIKPEDKSLKIPHMGWNDLDIVGSHPIISGIDDCEHVYFTHSYQMKCNDISNIIAEVGYGGKITAIVAQDNIIGTQFHPEKSQKTGLKIIHNFLAME